MIGEEQDIEAGHRLKADDLIKTPLRNPLEASRECTHPAVIAQGLSRPVDRDCRNADIGQLAGRVHGDLMAAAGELVRNANRVIFEPASGHQPENADCDPHDAPGVVAAPTGGCSRERRAQSTRMENLPSSPPGTVPTRVAPCFVTFPIVARVPLTYAGQMQYRDRVYGQERTFRSGPFKMVR